MDGVVWILGEYNDNDKAKAIAERGHCGAEIYMFADMDEAWYLEVHTGHQWAAVKMPEDKVACFAGTVWFSLANAEHSVFLPLNAAVTDTDEAYSRDRTEKPWGYDPSLAGNAFRRLCALAEQNRRFYGTGVREFWRKREHELLTDYPKALAKSVAGNDASAVTDFAKREQSCAFKDALWLFDDLMWYIIENNRIEGDGSGATTLPVKVFQPLRAGTGPACRENF